MLAVCMLALIVATCNTAQAVTHNVYDGNISSSYVTYFKDIVSGIGFNDNYVGFRSGQYEYTLVTGKMELSNGEITLLEKGMIYTFDQSNSSYNSHTTYNYNEIDNFSVSVGDNILYTDLGNYPQLVERGEKFEILTTVLVVTLLLSYVIKQFFVSR